MAVRVSSHREGCLGRGVGTFFWPTLVLPPLRSEPKPPLPPTTRRPTRRGGRPRACSSVKPNSSGRYLPLHETRSSLTGTPSLSSKACLTEAKVTCVVGKEKERRRPSIEETRSCIFLGLVVCFLFFPLETTFLFVSCPQAKILAF